MIKSKHSQEASTMVWIIATVIIIFIVFIFLALTLFMSEKDKIKNLFQSPSNIEIEKNAEQDIALAESIYGVLNTKVEFDGKKVKVVDMIEESLNPYIELKLSLTQNTGVREDITLVDKYAGGNINKFYFASIDQNVKDHIPEIKKAIDNDNKMFGVLADILNPICRDYMFKIPQGVIRKGKSKFIPENDIYNVNYQTTVYATDPILWTPWTTVNLFYKGKVVEIKYKRKVVEIKYKRMIEC